MQLYKQVFADSPPTQQDDVINMTAPLHMLPPANFKPLSQLSIGNSGKGCIHQLVLTKEFYA